MKISKLSQIATKKGDTGMSANYEGDLFPKSDRLFDVLGSLDECESILGICYHYGKNEDLKKIQKDLEKAAAQVASHPHENFSGRMDKLTVVDITWLELSAQTMLDKKNLDPGFVLPGSETTLAGAYYDFARTVVRRCERSLWKFIEKNNRDDLNIVAGFVNRLSDYLYVLARFEENS
ncbi:MAG TPA: ATP:cob(I)alamin adenosyltransferase [Bacillota bacterium]|nr:ATP:cob(I)alamin adenosyltransferase [Bacillota bacterium]HRX91456.1 ATP:cob(I)alamin adenosyltransferase [Candidatus Izemoplasmatales bacterium]